jgi:hypothetical protein
MIPPWDGCNVVSLPLSLAFHYDLDPHSGEWLGATTASHHDEHHGS